MAGAAHGPLSGPARQLGARGSPPGEENGFGSSGGAPRAEGPSTLLGRPALLWPNAGSVTLL